MFTVKNLKEQNKNLIEEIKSIKEQIYKINKNKENISIKNSVIPYIIFKSLSPISLFFFI